MSVRIIKKTLTNKHFEFSAFCFLPSEKIDWRSEVALFTHGYTASKSDCVNWAQRTAELGIPTCIFDLPGHHLGSLNMVESFDIFKEHSVQCFVTAYEFLKENLKSMTHSKLIIGGHSLGALLSLKALNLPEFNKSDKLAIAVGLGIGQHASTHLFDTDFYKNTLNIRRQLVDATIDSELIFPWIREEKLNLELTGSRVHLITGKDDVVVGKSGAQSLELNLTNLGNDVSLVEPNRLPHHEPSLAASQISSFLKKELCI